jgi:hypothetical protein
MDPPETAGIGRNRSEWRPVWDGTSFVPFWSTEQDISVIPAGSRMEFITMVAKAIPAVARRDTAARSGRRDGRRQAAAVVTSDSSSDERVRGGEERVTELVDVWVVLGEV